MDFINHKSEFILVNLPRALHSLKPSLLGKRLELFCGTPIPRLRIPSRIAKYVRFYISYIAWMATNLGYYYQIVICSY